MNVNMHVLFVHTKATFVWVGKVGGCVVCHMCKCVWDLADFLQAVHDLGAGQCERRGRRTGVSGCAIKVSSSINYTIVRSIKSSLRILSKWS